jgi:hypothetical protein
MIPDTLKLVTDTLKTDTLSTNQQAMSLPLEILLVVSCIAAAIGMIYLCNRLFPKQQ